MIRLAGHVAHFRQMRNAYKILVGKPQGKKLFWKPRCKWKGNIKMHLKEKGKKMWAGLNWLRIQTVCELL
jgi:hypothetical protein